MRNSRLASTTLLWVFLSISWALPAQEQQTVTPVQGFTGALQHALKLFNADPPQTFQTRLKLLRGDGLPKDMVGKELALGFQYPDRIRLSAEYEGQKLEIGRDGQELWVHAPQRHFGVVGGPGVPRFAGVSDSVDNKSLGPLKLPFMAEQILVLPLLMNLEALPDAKVGEVPCRVISGTPKPEAITALNMADFRVKVWCRQSDNFPLRVSYVDRRNREYTVELVQAKYVEPWPAEKWKISPQPGDKIERVARSHLSRFFATALDMMGDRVPTLGPATGERKLVAREGEGRLEKIDGTRVLFVKGTPEEMGRQHGILLKSRVQSLVDRMLYGVGVGSSFEKGRWFFSEIESAQTRLMPFMDARYIQEMDALAKGAGLPREEVRLANFFPELFHCSGFAIFGSATEGGQMYHGRILDYLRGMGLEQNAVVIVYQPDKGNAWVNVSYAGFVGSVTAMNEKHVAIGEMGGRGEGNWDGKPMAQLVREVMEKADTLEQAVEIMRKGPRTCEYYYVISDAKTQRAVGIAATPNKFETIWPGKSHPQLPHAIPDAVLMSANDRYEELARRVKDGFGKFDAERARDLMKRPVCMTSNIHSVLFAPGTLDFWVANADSENPAAHTRYTHYNLATLLKSEPPQ